MTARIRIAVAATALTIALVAAGASAASGTAGTVSVSAQVRATSAVTTLADGNILVQANAPWHLVCDTPEGPVEVSGSRTTGTTVRLPAGTFGYSVSVD